MLFSPPFPSPSMLNSRIWFVHKLNSPGHLDLQIPRLTSGQQHGYYAAWFLLTVSGLNSCFWRVIQPKVISFFVIKSIQHLTITASIQRPSVSIILSILWLLNIFLAINHSQKCLSCLHSLNGLDLSAFSFIKTENEHSKLTEYSLWEKEIRGTQSCTTKWASL